MQNWVKNYRGIAFGLLCLVLGILALQAFLPFVPALLWAIVLSILTYPLYVRLEKRFAKMKLLKDGRSESASSLVITLTTLLIICIPFILIGAGVFLQIGSITNDLQPGKGLTLETVLAQVDEMVKPMAEKVGATNFSISKYVEEHKEELTQNLRQPVQNFGKQALTTILTLVFALLTQFFMLRDSHRLKEPAFELQPFGRTRYEELLAKISATVRAVFVGTVLVAVLQGFVIGVTYALVGVPNALLLGVFSVMLCIIPLLGAPVIYVPVGFYLMAEGKTTEAMIVLGVGFLIVSQIDNLIKPFLIGNQINLHPMAIFFAILGGVILLGPIGVMAGPMLLTALLVCQDAIRDAKAEKLVTVPA
jgi:predicted PurR-regulated permease PerM